MIKINLLESITDRPTGAAMVEAKVASPRVQTLLLAITVFGLLVLGVSYDFLSSKSAHTFAQNELENQKRINQQMLAVNKEQADLEKKAQDIQGRIDAIKKLRESQQGPSAVLREIKTRFDGVPGLYLKSVEQKDGELRSRVYPRTSLRLRASGKASSFHQDCLQISTSKLSERPLVVRRTTRARPAKKR